jgi:general secretion pathway protein D
VPGTGEVIGAPPKVSPATEGKGDITLNFANAAIGEVVRAVLGDLLGLNYTISPKIEGNITIRTSRPLTRAAALPALEDALRLQGVAIVKVGNVYQVVPAADAPRSPTVPMILDKQELRTPGYGIEVVPLKFIAASQMEKVLNSVAPDGGVLYVDTTRNLLLLGGTPDRLTSLLDMVAIFDIDLMRGMSFALIPLEHSDAKSVGADLEKIFNINKDNLGSIRVLPITRLNSVLVISPEMENIEHARKWIRSLDQSDKVGQQLHVYYLQNGRAKDVASVLGKLFGATTAGPQRGALAPGYAPAEIESPAIPPPALSSGGLSSGLSSPGSSAPGLSSLGVSPGTPPIGTSGPPPSAPGELGMAPPAKTSPTAPSTSETSEASVVQFTATAPVRIVAAPDINALVIYASAADYDTILQALKQIDIAPLQVLIEATIAEVTLSGDFSYGVQWFLNGIDSTFAQNVSNAGSVANGMVSSTAGAASKAGAVATALFSHSFTYTGTTDNFHVVLNAISHQTDVNIVSSPSLMVLDNQIARIQVGDQVPVLTQQAVSTITAGAPVINSVQYIDSGVILEIKPHVNKGGQVMLDITQQVSQPVTTTTSTIDSPTIQQRLITSTITVRSGETVTLGGLISDNASKTGQGIPALRKWPVIGPLFGITGKSTTRTELLVFLTPRVIRDWSDAHEVSEELSSRMRSLTPLGSKIQ